MLAICIFTFNFFFSEDEQFVNNKSGFVLVEQKEGKVLFHDPILEAEMLEIGVVIPPSAQERYNNKERIKFGEEGFFEAFKEFYSVYIYDPDDYTWHD